jgi:hypothetical protein
MCFKLCDNMNKGKINTPGTGNTGATTTSGDVKETIFVDGMYHLKEPFPCVNCENILDKLTEDRKCPHCGFPYKNLLI